MNWKYKAVIQNIVAALPKSYPDKLYYVIQRKFGDLKSVNPTEHLKAAAKFFMLAVGNQTGFMNKVFFELGTGRRLNVPIALWLLGAKKVITVDLNNYLKKELVEVDLNFIANNPKEIISILGENNLRHGRLTDLISFSRTNWKIDELLKLCQIEYMPGTDASDLDFLKDSIDYYISNTVLEHIPFNELEKIIVAGKNYLVPNGLFIHFVDYIDHFHYSDAGISKINFLKYSNSVWSFIAGNKFMYMNRKRHSDYLKLIADTGNLLVIEETVCDDELKKLIYEKKIKINSMFRNKSDDDFFTVNSWLVFKTGMS